MSQLLLLHCKTYFRYESVDFAALSKVVQFQTDMHTDYLIVTTQGVYCMTHLIMLVVAVDAVGSSVCLSVDLPVHHMCMLCWNSFICISTSCLSF